MLTTILKQRECEIIKIKFKIVKNLIKNHRVKHFQKTIRFWIMSDKKIPCGQVGRQVLGID